MTGAAEGVQGLAERGIVAAGHPLTAQAGARVLRQGGNAVDAAIAAMLTSFVAEPLLTGLGAGGYMIVAGGGPPAVLDFFVEAPPRRTDQGAAELEAVDVSFGDADQVFHIGPASCGVYGAPAGVCEASSRWGTMPLSDLAEPAAQLARDGVMLNAQQAYVAQILSDLLRSTPECAGLWAPAGRLLGEGDILRNHDLACAIERLGAEGEEPFYKGDIGAAVSAWLTERGGAIGPEELASYRAIERAPIPVRYRDRHVYTNPPPAAGGMLLAYALSLIGRSGERESGEGAVKDAAAGAVEPRVAELLAAMEAAQAERTPEFLEGLCEEGFLQRFASSRLGGTTHISVMDANGLACGVTATNGEGSGVVVPGTGIHVNNMMGEQDLNPLGFHRHPAGRRMPSMVAPSVVMRSGEVEMVLGSAGSNRIRSALLQTIVSVVDRGMTVIDAVRAPRVHCEDGVIYHEPGIEIDPHLAAGRQVVSFHDLNLFFGGVQAVQRRDGRLIGAGDPRRGGVAVRA